MKTPVLFDVKPTGKVVSKRKSPAINRIKVDHEIAKKRYYLHRRINKRYPLDGAKRVLELPYASFDTIPKKDQKYITKLIALGYNIQFKLV